MSTIPEQLISTLTPKQHQALALLAEGQSITSVANTCDLHRTTIHYWKRNNLEFAYALHDAKSEHADHWRAASQQRAEAALALIDTFLADPKTPATVRLKAALHILNAATAPPPKFQQTHHEDPYRAANQLLQQMEADEAARIQFYLDSFKARQQAGVAHLPDPEMNSSQFITSSPSNENPKEPAAVTLPHSKQNSSEFVTSNNNDENDYKVATIRHAEPPTGRNQTCPCKSGKKFKHCCLNKPKAA